MNVLSDRTLKRLDEFWGSEIGCSETALHDQSKLVVALPAKDGSEFARVFRRGAGCVLTCSPSLLAVLQIADRCRPDGLDDEQFLRSALGARVREVLSGVYLGYVDSAMSDPPLSRVRMLREVDIRALETLRTGVTERDWEYSGLTSSQPVAGCFVNGELVAAAGYDIWGGRIAHVGVVTASGQRERGYGRDVVSRIVNHAISGGLVAQYQTLRGNLASMAVAAALGFNAYAEYTYAVVGQPN